MHILAQLQTQWTLLTIVDLEMNVSCSSAKQISVHMSRLDASTPSQHLMLTNYTRSETHLLGN